MDDGSDDLRYLIAGADALAPYLESDVLFWPLQFESQPLTIGNLLLAQKRVAAFSSRLDPQVQKADATIEKERSRWEAAWKRKASADFHARLAQYRSTLTDAAEEDGAGVNYSVLARLRTIIELLLGETDGDIRLENQLAALDGQLQRLTEPGEFLWPSQLQSAFPSDKFWFLYAKFVKGWAK